jgi:hypothetical protein
MPAHHPSRNPSAQRSRSQQLTHANGNGNGHGRANGNAAGSIEQTIAGGVAVLTPRFVRCGTFVFNLDHVVSLKFSDADVSVQLSDGAVAMIQDARAAATLLRLLQCGDDVLDITPPPANGESLGLITFARYGTRLDVRVEHERITPAAGTNGAHPPINGKRVAKIRPGKVKFLRGGVTSRVSGPGRASPSASSTTSLPTPQRSSSPSPQSASPNRGAAARPSGRRGSKPRSAPRRGPTRARPKHSSSP